MPVALNVIPLGVAVGVEVGVAVAVGVASLGGKGSVAAESGSGTVSGHDPEMISGARS